MSGIADELRKLADSYGSGNYQVLYDFAGRIDAEMVELPRDIDGAPIHVGDTVYGCISGRQSQATGLRLEDEWVILTNHGFGEPHIFTHASPDSLESIADELDEFRKDSANSCEICADGEDTLYDLAERIRKLAKDGE